jgi:hypothetical protein
MPVPPSQKGKFKPRKPAKKIHVGVAEAATVVPDPAPSSAVQRAASVSAAQAATAGTGRGGRGQGREGGRGTGRGRAPVPQGQVFFTATTQAAKKTRSAGSTGANNKAKAATDNKSLLVQCKDTEAYKEVVGTLDKAIGSEVGKAEKKSVLESYDDSDYLGQGKYYEKGQEGGASQYLPEDGFTYDSDSSLEEAKARP